MTLTRRSANLKSRKLEQAAIRFLRRYLDEKSPTLKNFAKVVRQLEQRPLLLDHGMATHHLRRVLIAPKHLVGRVFGE